MAKNYFDLMTAVKLISQLQFDLLPEFIPRGFKEVWKEGLRHNEYHLKICGAGGGGFIIGFAAADTKLDLLLGSKDVIELMKF
jgi:mevalonate kinase